MKMKYFLQSFLLSLTIPFGLAACSNNISIDTSQITGNSIVSNNSTNTFMIDVGKGKPGGRFLINLEYGKLFKTQASSNGIKEKTEADIMSVNIYLIKSNQSLYPLNSDPLGADLVDGPFTLDRNVTIPQTITFNNVSPNVSGESYFVAVRAYNQTGATGIELIKPNNGSATGWTGTTATSNRVAVSSGTGVTVDSTFAVNTTAPLSVTLNLSDAIGPSIEGEIEPVSGNNTLPAFSVN